MSFSNLIKFVKKWVLDIWKDVILSIIDVINVKWENVEDYLH
jgi:hypothetical protein